MSRGGDRRTPPSGIPGFDELASTSEIVVDPIEEALDKLRARDDFGVRDLELARIVIETVALRLRPPAVVSGGDRFATRLADLETWRKTEVDPWRMKLTGVDDANGRLGKMDRAIAELRHDIGTPDQAQVTRETAANMRSIKRRTIAALGTAALCLGGAGYKLVIQRDASLERAAAAAARIELRLEHVEQRLERHDRLLLRFPGRTSAAADPDPDNYPDPRIP